MKRILSALFALALLLALLPAQALAANTVTINVYNWGQYISDGTDDSLDVIAAFEKAYPNIKVNYMTFDSNESMYAKLEAGGASFDVIFPSDYMVEKMIADDMLEPLDFENIPNFDAYLDESFRDPPYDPTNAYSVPYTWGYVGIIYNTRFVNEADLTGWELLWNNAYAGKILMFDNPRDAFAIAEADLGISLNSRDFDELRAAADLLRAQKNLVQSYVMDQIFDKMERGEAWIAPYYAGDYLTMVEVNPELGFYLPDEGYNRFVDAICIPKGCEHKKEAETFINFLISPEICGQNLEYLGYSSPYSASKAYMSEEVAENEIAYPSEEQLANGEIFQSLGGEATQEMNRLWLEVKASDASTTVYLILTGATVASIIPWALLRLRRRRKKAQRCAKWRRPA